MTLIGWLQIGLLFLIVLALVKPLGLYMARVFSGERTFLSPVLAPVERGFYAASGIDPKQEQGWLAYTFAMLAFSMAGFASLYLILRCQAWLPLNPQGFANVPPDLAFNTAVSFVTNTNWQSYGGETTMSHFSQMAGLTVHNFVSAATGIAMALALTRAFARSGARDARQFLGRPDPRDALRAAAAVASSWRSPLSPWACRRRSMVRLRRQRVEGAQQTIALGPVASQEAIKQLGTNGGGFFNVNAAHPFENPTALSNYLNIVAMLSVSAALVYAFGQMVGDRRQGWAFLAVTAVFLLDRHRGDLLGRNLRQSDPDRARHRSSARQYGRQGGALRPGHDGCLCGSHHRPVGWRRQRHAWLVHRAWRAGADVPHPARRGAAGRRRIGPLRHAGFRHPGGLRRRPDGRPHARIARQEDRKPRDEIRHAGRADPAAGDPRLHRDLRDAALRGQRASAPAGRMACRRSSMPTPRRPATTARPLAG